MSCSIQLRFIASLCPLLLAASACDRPRESLPNKSSLTCQAPPPRAADSFGSFMRAAMAQMDAAMMFALSGNPDRDFAGMMIPHHQGAVDMALAELRFGHDEQLRRLASGIIVEQRSEIALMQRIVAEMTPTTSDRVPAPPTVLVSAQGAR